MKRSIDMEQRLTKQTLEINLQDFNLKNQRTEEPKNQRTKEPKNQRTKKPKNQKTKEPKNQKTKDPKNQKTKEPKNQRTKRPKMVICKLTMTGETPEMLRQKET